MKFLLSFALLLFSITVFGQTSETVTQTVYKSGIGLGSVIAVVTSWDRNHSVLWAILHGILSWIYVIYYLFSR